jgi:hypothetical protein
MRAPIAALDMADNARRLGRHALVVRALTAVAGVVCWITMTVVGRGDLLLSVLLLAAIVPAVMRPDTTAPLVLIMVMTAEWLFVVRPMSVGWSLVLAGCVLVVHVASARAAAMAEHAVLDPAVVRRWLAQTAVVVSVTTLVWCFAVLLHDRPGPGGVAVTAVALVAFASFAVGLRRWSADS